MRGSHERGPSRRYRSGEESREALAARRIPGDGDHEEETCLRSPRRGERPGSVIPGPRCRLLHLVCVLCLLTCSSDRAAVVPYRDLRYESVVGQTSEYTCGAAAVATLLRFHFGIPASEAEIVSLAEGSMVTRGTDPQHGEGISAYDLKVAIESRGLGVAGYRLTLGQLQDYFERGGLPVIVHITVPSLHFLVVAGMLREFALLADPAWGRRIVETVELESKMGMSGTVLVPLPDSVLAEEARASQSSAIAWMQARLMCLSALREAMP